VGLAGIPTSPNDFGSGIFQWKLIITFAAPTVCLLDRLIQTVATIDIRAKRDIILQR
jgi:hypothetical protein